MEEEVEQQQIINQIMDAMDELIDKNISNENRMIALFENKVF